MQSFSWQVQVQNGVSLAANARAGIWPPDRLPCCLLDFKMSFRGRSRAFNKYFFYQVSICNLCIQTAIYEVAGPLCLSTSPRKNRIRDLSLKLSPSSPHPTRPLSSKQSAFW
jgi:hypothetical protein